MAKLDLTLRAAVLLVLFVVSASRSDALPTVWTVTTTADTSDGTLWPSTHRVASPAHNRTKRGDVTARGRAGLIET